MGIFHAFFLHEFVAERGTCPRPFGYFVSSDVNRCQRYASIFVHFNDFVADFIHETIDGGQGYIHNIVGIGLCRYIFRCVGRFGKEIFPGFFHVFSFQSVESSFHRFDSRACMSRRFYFGYDGDVSFCSVLQYLDEIFSGIISVCRGCGIVWIPASVIYGIQALAFVFGESSARPYCSEFFQSGDF